MEYFKMVALRAYAIALFRDFNKSGINHLPSPSGITVFC
jgi:hypothetical protein